MNEENRENEALEADITEIDLETPDAEPASYELGYHVVPSVSEDAVPGVVAALRSAITERGGAMLSEGNPEHVRLAYGVGKVSEGKRRMYDMAYFGWVRFTITPPNALELKKLLDTHPQILRFLLIRLTRDELAYVHRPPRPPVQPGERKPETETPTAEDRPKEPVKKEEPMSEAELDKQIEEMVK